MSGGSWDYFSGPLHDVASRLIDEKHASEYELRAALGRLLQAAAEALHMIEWVDSCDCAKGSERDALVAVFDEGAQKVESRELLRQLRELEMKIYKLEKKHGNTSESDTEPDVNCSRART